MYEEIEKQYIKNNPDVKFSKFYWLISISLCPAYLGIIKCFKLSSVKVSFYIVLPISLLTLIIYIVSEIYKNTDKTKKKIKVKDKIKNYNKKIDKEQFNSLIKTLKKYNINTKDKLELTITYYSNKLIINNTKKTPLLLNIIITYISTIVLNYGLKNFSNIKTYIISFIIIYICYCIVINSIKPKNSTTKLINDLSQLYMKLF